MGVGLSVTKRYMGVGGYLADRYVALILNFIQFVFSLSTEGLVQLRRECAMNKTVLCTL